MDVFGGVWGMIVFVIDDVGWCVGCIDCFVVFDVLVIFVVLFFELCIV